MLTHINIHYINTSIHMTTNINMHRHGLTIQMNMKTTMKLTSLRFMRLTSVKMMCKGLAQAGKLTQKFAERLCHRDWQCP